MQIDKDQTSRFIADNSWTEEWDVGLPENPHLGRRIYPPRPVQPPTNRTESA